MARRASRTPELSPDHARELLIEEYRERLHAIVPVPDWEWPPVYIGPTWQRDGEGRFILPERSLGWEALAWCGQWLQVRRDQPWRFTPEQARWVLHWYSVDEHGAFLYDDAVLQRLKGWGKDPLAAALEAFEMLGPCRFGGWGPDGQPVGIDVPGAWIQNAAVSLEQTKNTMRLFPTLFSARAKREFGVQIGKEKVYALEGDRLIEAVTSSPATLEGGRPTTVVLNETHLWLDSNEGHEMAAVISRNTAKSADGAARKLRITNAYEPGEDSVAERDRDTWERIRAGEIPDPGLLYDSIEANAEAPLTDDHAPAVVRAIRGDATWLHEQRIVREILDYRNPPSQSRRWWYNQIVASEDSWTTPQEWDACQDSELRPLEAGERIALFFDGSKSDDVTWLEACRLEDGAVFRMAHWQRPDKAAEWSVPRDEVGDLVDAAFARYDVRAMFADPGTGEDDTGLRYWDALIDRWAHEYGDQLDLWAVPSGPERHPILWPMTSPTRQKLFTEAVERTLDDIRSKALPHDGDYATRIHITNARRRPNRWGVSIGKESRESQRKIDGAVCVVGSRMVRRMWLALPSSKRRKQRTGRAQFA